MHGLALPCRPIPGIILCSEPLYFIVPQVFVSLTFCVVFVGDCLLAEALGKMAEAPIRIGIFEGFRNHAFLTLGTAPLIGSIQSTGALAATAPCDNNKNRPSTTAPKVIHNKFISDSYFLRVVENTSPVGWLGKVCCQAWSCLRNYIPSVWNEPPFGAAIATTTHAKHLHRQRAGWVRYVYRASLALLVSQSRWLIDNNQ